jgi:membrane protease YdiL (CAAX protease family)
LTENPGKAVDIINHWQILIPGLPSWGKLGIFLMVWILLWLPIAIPIAGRIGWRIFQPLTPQQKLPLLGSLYLIAPLILWGAMQITGNNWQDYGLNWQRGVRSGIEILWGIGLSVFSLVIVFGIELLTGLATWHRERQGEVLPQLIPILCLALWISATEELLFRGYLVVELAADYPLWAAILMANGIFALLHLLWEQRETLPQIPGLWLMGMVLSYAWWLVNGQLWLAIGLHAGWIWGLTCLDTAQLISYTPKSDWFTGLNKQPLAGVGGILCLLLTLLMLAAIGSFALHLHS